MDYATLTTEAARTYARLWEAQDLTCDSDNPARDYARLGRLLVAAHRRYTRRAALDPVVRCEDCEEYYCVCRAA